jgi:hypothetical protein
MEQMKLQLATCTIFRQLSDQVESTKLISDNCVGQIKNNVAMQYFCWRTVQGLNSKIKSSFMLPYHTRFGQDLVWSDQIKISAFSN